MARTLIQEEIDRKRLNEKFRKIQEIKQWRLDHSKNRDDMFKSQRQEDLQQELKHNEEVQRKHLADDMKKEMKRKQ